MHDIARNLKRLRRQKGLTQEELADKLHVTRQAVSNWERNQNLPELEVLLAAAEALEVSMDELLYGPRPAERPDGPENRRKRIVTAAALWAVWGVLLAIYLIGRPTVADYMRLAYDGTAYMAFMFVLGPAVYLTLGMAVCALVCIWRDLHPHRPAVRRALFWTGLGVTALLTLLLLVLPRCADLPGVWPRLMGLWLALSEIHTSGLLHLLCGGMIFCGWGKSGLISQADSGTMIGVGL